MSADERDTETLAEDVRQRWRREAEAHPSGQRCNGIHDATADRRVIVLLDELARIEQARAEEGAESVEWGVSCRGEVFPASEKNARSLVCHDHCSEPVVVRRTVRVSEWTPVPGDPS